MSEKNCPTTGLFDVATAIEESAMNLAIGVEMMFNELQELESADREGLGAARNHLHFIALGMKSIGDGLGRVSSQAYSMAGETKEENHAAT